MASRRILKKNIHCLLHEVAMEAYIGSFFLKDFDEGKFCDFLKQVYEIGRASCRERVYDHVLF